MKAPTRVLVVEDIDTWVYMLSRAARRAGASEVVVCGNLQAVRDALRSYRFDVAILDIGLDPDDDRNADGVKALEAIREADGSTTRCILVTGWQGGDRMDLQSSAHHDYGVDWAYMKEKFEAHAVINKLTEMLEQTHELRIHHLAPIDNLCATMGRSRLEAQLLSTLSPTGGIQTIYSLASRLLGPVIPVVAMHPSIPMEIGSDGAYVGLYWSRVLATAVAVGLASTAQWQEDEGLIPAGLVRQLPVGVQPELIEHVRERNVQGLLWELPGIGRDEFLG